MLVEIPEPDVIMSVIIAFFIGLFALYLSYKIKKVLNAKQKQVNPGHLERLEFYEKQLIDMKIRLDALDVVDLGMKPEIVLVDPEETQQKTAPYNEKITNERKREVIEPELRSRMPNLGYDDVTNHVLRLITDHSMTSRDIQITIGRTREHTSRLMKKLFEDGYVKRNTTAKPYTYSITEQGLEKTNLQKATPSVV